MDVQKVWPESNRHYLCCDETRWLPYISNALQLIRWAFNEGLIDEEPEYVLSRPAAIDNSNKGHVRILGETDKRTVLRVVAKMGRSSLVEISAFMESDMACIGKALGDLLKDGLVDRSKIGVMVSGKVRSRWFYSTRLSEDEALSCAAKLRHQSREAANEAARRTNKPCEPYKCRFCTFWHVGRL